jgi:mevalonate kinase
MDSAPRHFYSNGKLLITSEYLVLHGALALAIPVKKGQSLTVSYSPQRTGVYWKARVLGNDWFEAELSGPDFFVKSTNQPAVAERLKKFLQVALEMNPKWMPSEGGLEIFTNLDFNKEWGFGSSSTLVSNIAYMAEIDLFDYYFRIFNGSGYDVASARVNYPILYQLKEGKPAIHPIDFFPEFHESIYFVYSGKKQSSDKSVIDFQKKASDYHGLAEQLSRLTNKIVAATSLDEFNLLIREHENLLSPVLGQKPVKTSLFPDFEGEIKSLGAWGGDFYLVTFRKPKEELFKYFSKFGLHTIIPFADISFKKGSK